MGDPLGLLETRNAFQSFASVQIDDFNRPILETGHKESFAVAVTSMWSIRPSTFGIGIVWTRRSLSVFGVAVVETNPQSNSIQIETNLFIATP